MMMIKKYDKNDVFQNELAVIENLKHALYLIENKDDYNAFINLDIDSTLKKIKKLDKKEENTLYGVPIAIKDIFDIKGRLTSNGTYYGPKQLFPEKSSYIVEKLERMDAILIGKTNMYEYSMDVTSENVVYGDVINPLNDQVTAGGSSSGSAVSVSSGLVPFAIGSDTSGSTRIPASCNGIVGFKLGHNHKYLEGMTTISKELDHIGIFSETVKGSQLIFNAINTDSDIINNKAEKAKVKIGIPNTYFNEHNDEIMEKVMEFAYQNFNLLGYELVQIDTSFLEDIETMKISRTIGTRDISLTQTERDQKGYYRTENIKSIVEHGRNISIEEYENALKTKENITNKFNELFAEVDIILTPVMPIITPLKNKKTIEFNKVTQNLSDVMMLYTNVFNLTGHPAISIPSGYVTRNISQGIQLVVNKNQESILFEVANAYEHYVKE
ncbi:amidase [Mammaliicoccus lentus]|uniref:amidase n=1 Tax=Mammaliicoccus lentus TaxID=42858 RepID=UPI0026475832|nr:amidase [Mammaliicoccus lentus]